MIIYNTSLKYFNLFSTINMPQKSYVRIVSPRLVGEHQHMKDKEQTKTV